MREPSPLPPPVFRPQKAGWWSSFGHAWAGLIHTVVHQPHMRVHVAAAMLVGLVGSGIPLGLAEKVTLVFCVLLIFFAEILNSALEQLVDLAIQQFDEKARLTKDAAAAGVLVLAIGTVVIFAAVLVHNWETVASHQAQIVRQVVIGVPFTLMASAVTWPWKRPAVVDVALILLSSALFVLLALRTTSVVFTAMTFGLLVVAACAAWERRRAGDPLADSRSSRA